MAAGLLTSQVNTHMILAFMEYLHSNAQSKSNIANYLSAIRAFHIIYGLPTASFKDERLPLFLKSIEYAAPLKPKKQYLIDIPMLHNIIQQSDNMANPLVFKALYLTCFFSFLRLSNILPHSANSFDFTRQLAHGDFIVHHQSALLLIKWSKTIQNRRDTITLPLPFLGTSPLCPIAALTNMIQAFPAEQNEPLFIIPLKHGFAPLTDSVVRKHLKAVSVALHITPPLTFHAFRKAGASWAFHNGVPLEFIKKHGTWKSDAIHMYLLSAPSFSSPVSQAFTRYLHS